MDIEEYMRQYMGKGLCPWQSPKSRKKQGKSAPTAAGAIPTAKQGRADRSEDEERTQDQDEPWEEHLQRLLHKIPNGAREYEQIMSKVNKAMEKLLQDSKLEKKILEVVKKDKEVDVCSRSLMAFNVDKWKGEDEDVPLEEKITEDLHRMCKQRVTVTEVIAFKQQEGRPMAARITLGSSRQKRTLFRAIADNIKKKTRYGSCVQAVSLRTRLWRPRSWQLKVWPSRGRGKSQPSESSAKDRPASQCCRPGWQEDSGLCTRF